MPAAMDHVGWTDLVIGDHPVALYVPRQIHPHGYTLLFLHDCDGTVPRESSELVRQASDAGLRIVAPLAGPTWWLDCLAPPFDPTRTAIEYLRVDLLAGLEQHLAVTPPRIGLLGIGMGGQGALMLSYRDPRQFPVVAALAPAIDFHQLVPHEDPILTEVFGGREWARQHTAILHVHPLHWPPHQFFCCDPEDTDWFDSSDRLRMKLNSIGVPSTCDLETSGGGHSWQYFDHMLPRAIRFVLDGLDRERLRLV